MTGNCRTFSERKQFGTVFLMRLLTKVDRGMVCAPAHGCKGSELFDSPEPVPPGEISLLFKKSGRFFVSFRAAAPAL